MVFPKNGAGKLTSVDASLQWLVGVSLLCLVLVFGLRGYFNGLQDELKQRGANERARLFVGDEIVRGIQGVEKDIYRMAVTQNAAGFSRVKIAVDAQLNKLQHDLEVLKTGGISRRVLQTNMDGKDELSREATYLPEDASRFVIMELLEISPHILQIREQVTVLEQLLALRWKSVEANDRGTFFQTEEDIALLLKKVPPHFERLNENANRLFVEGDQRLRALESKLENQTTQLKQLETGLISLVVVLGGITAVLFMRRLTGALGETRRARDDTERQREQNATILDTLNDGVYATDMQGNITFINAAGERMLGWSATELVGRHSHQTIHHTRTDGQPYATDQCPLIEVLRQGASLNGEEHFVSRTGRFVPVSYRSQPLLHSGKMAGSLVSFHDISDRIESQARIRLQQAALDAAANMIVITNSSGQIEYVNPAFSRTTGYSAQDVIGQSTSVLSSGLHGPAFFQAMWQTLLSGQAWEGELSNRRKNAEIYVEQMTITPIVEDGEIAHFVAIKRDISEEIRTRTRLRLVESAIQETEQGIHIMDAEPHPQGPVIQYINAGFSRLTGYSEQELIGVRVGVLRGPDTDSQKLKDIQQSVSRGLSITREMSYRRKDGTPFTGELHLSPVHAETGKVSHYIGLLSDIDLRKQAEAALRDARDQALEHSRLKSEFLSTMSHEIRTPMNGIIGMTDLLLDTVLDNEQREFTGIVRDSAQALLVIINDILDFSKIEAGKLEIEIADYACAQVMEGAVELLSARAQEKSLVLTSFVDPALPGCLRGDPTRLRQVLLNLIGNAIKFTETGSVEVSALLSNDGHQPQLRFEVIDSGIGIAPVVQSRLFQSFTQADSSTTRKYGGTGLGLAICQRLVKLMGGHIGVHSESGKGSTFWFTLPLVPCASLAADDPMRCQTLLDRKGLRVLVVDDHLDDRKVIHRYLNSWNLHNDGASNAPEAIKLLQDAHDLGVPFDVAIVDFDMPGMDGLGMANVLRADSRFDALRLILLSAQDLADFRPRAMAAGYAAWLRKPVRQSLLFDSLVVSENGESTDSSRQTPMVTPRHNDRSERLPVILLAEDNLINQRVAQLQINKLGYALHIVNNGQEAVEAVAASASGKSRPFAAILMDCQMPLLDGFEATARIRQSQGDGDRAIPIIAMTANAMQGDRERCLAAGMDDYLSKPINPEQLSMVLNKWAAPLQTENDSSPARDPDPVIASPESTDSGLIIDFDLLDDYFGDDPQTVNKLLALFESSTTRLLSSLQDAIGRRESAAVHALTHELRGSCGNIGIDRMAHISAKLESSVATRDWAQVDELHQTLRAAFADVVAVIASR
jgi:two-component system sensor histidine kinase/response regulator